MLLQNKRVIIIGGSSGIGLATAKSCVQAGAQVVIASRSQEKLDLALQEMDHNVTTAQLDASMESEVCAFFSNIGNFDHLVTTISSSSPGSCVKSEISVAQSSFQSKFWGQYFAVKYGAPLLQKEGSIILFSGVYGKRPVMDTAIMASINSAIEGLGRALAIELAPLRVNVISPGYIDTPRFSSIRGKDLSVTKNLLIKRIGQSEEAAQSVLYLLSNGYTTGTTLYIDGGYTV